MSEIVCNVCEKDCTHEECACCNKFNKFKESNQIENLVKLLRDVAKELEEQKEEVELSKRIYFLKNIMDLYSFEKRD